MTTDDLLEKCKEAYRHDDYEGLLGLCSEILKRDLNNPQALGYKAKALYLMGEHEGALKLLENAMMLYPRNTYYLYIKADVLMGLEEYGSALECFERILEIGFGDDDGAGFIRGEYRTCLRLRTCQLIEMEKYVDAWKCYARLQEMEPYEIPRRQMIANFRGYVRDRTSKPKSRSYYVRISSGKAKSDLIRFLKENGFSGSDESGRMFSIDVISKTYNAVSVEEVGPSSIISESKFYDKVNYYPRKMIKRRKITDEFGNLLYEGYTLNHASYGFGTAYFANGNVYREGIFDIKGIVQGREYYPTGQLRFEGQWCLTMGYGPNTPCIGDAYSEDGELIHSGKFKIKRGGVGYPMIQKPKGFSPEQKDRPKIDYFKE